MDTADSEIVVWHGPDGLLGALVPIDSLTPDPHNARFHTERNRRVIRASLRKHGQMKNIVTDQDRVIVAGNGTTAEAKALGWTHIAATVYPGDTQAAREYAITDNRSAELAEWSWPVLGSDLGELRDRLESDALEDIGFTESEVAAIAVNHSWEGLPNPHAPSTSGVPKQIVLKVLSEQRYAEFLDKLRALVKKYTDTVDLRDRK